MRTFLKTELVKEQKWGKDYRVTKFLNFCEF